MLVGRNESALEEVRGICVAAGADTKVIVADLCVEKDVKRVVEDSINAYSSLDVLVCYHLHHLMVS